MIECFGVNESVVRSQPVLWRRLASADIVGELCHVLSAGGETRLADLFDFKSRHNQLCEKFL